MSMNSPNLLCHQVASCYFSPSQFDVDLFEGKWVSYKCLCMLRYTLSIEPAVSFHSRHLVCGGINLLHRKLILNLLYFQMDFFVFLARVCVKRCRARFCEFHEGKLSARYVSTCTLNEIFRRQKDTRDIMLSYIEQFKEWFVSTVYC